MIRKFFASLVVLIVLILAPILSLLYAALDTYLNPNFYQDEAVIEEVYELAAGYMEEAMAIGQEEMDIQAIDTELLVDSIRDVLPPEDIVTINTSVIDQLSQDPLPDELSIDLGNIKEKLPEAFTTVMSSYMENLELCTEEEQAMLAEDPEAQVACIPEGMDKEEFIAAMEEMDPNEMMKDFPEEYLIDMSNASPETTYIIQLFMNSNSLLKGIILAVYFVLVGLVALIIFKPAKSVMKWVGNTLFWSGLPLALIKPTMGQGVEAIMPRFTDQLPAMEAEQMMEGIKVLQGVLSFITDRMFWHGMILVVVGFALWLIGFLMLKDR